MTNHNTQFNSGFARFVSPQVYAWRHHIAWMVRFVGLACVGGWLANPLYQWTWEVPETALGPVWLDLVLIELRAPWLAVAGMAMAGREMPSMAGLGLAAALAVAGAILWSSALLAGLKHPFGRIPRRGAWLGLGRTWTEERQELRREGRASDGHGGSATVTVGLEPVSAWNVLAHVWHCLRTRDWAGLLRRSAWMGWRPVGDLGGDKLILGDSRAMSAVMQAAVSSFDGVVIRLGGGPKPLPTGGKGEEVRLMLGRDMDPDPLRQVRPGADAWEDIQAMVAPLQLGERRSILVAAFWALALETQPEEDRTMEGLVALLDDPAHAYQLLGGWFAVTTLIPEQEREAVRDLLRTWRARQPLLADDLTAVTDALCELMDGHRHWRLPNRRMMDLVQAGPRIISIEAAKTDPRSLRGSLPGLLLGQLLRELADSSGPELTRQVMIAVDPDCGAGLLSVLRNWRKDLKARGIILLLHFKDRAQVRSALGLHLRDDIPGQVSTLVAEPSMASDVLYRLGYAQQAFELTRPGELIVATAGRHMMRLRPIAPDQVAVPPVPLTDPPASINVPWSGPAITPPPGAPLPPPPTIVIKPVHRPRTVIVTPDGEEIHQGPEDESQPDAGAEELRQERGHAERRQERTTPHPRQRAEARTQAPNSGPPSGPTTPAPEFASSTRRLREALARRGGLPILPPPSRKL